MDILVWFGVFGAPFAWVTQFLVSFGTAIAACGPPDTPRQGPVNGVTIAATAAGATVAVLAGLSAILVLRKTSDADYEGAPPAGRLRFLAIVGLTVTPLFFFIIVLSGLGVVSLPGCRQG